MTHEELPEEETMICPNCGAEASGNYCSNCGQENHLHNETFMSMLTHFIAHYFHYESKFWQTIKLLITRPGFLTKEYFNGRRKRYVAPITLFIFTVVVYFIAASLLSTTFDMAGMKKARPYTISGNTEIPVKHVDTSYTITHEDGSSNTVTSTNIDAKTMGSKLLKFMPKLSFVMVPILASILSLMFMKRKSAKYLHHIIFSIHFFTFMFLVFFVVDIFSFNPIIYTILVICSAVGLYVYFMKALVAAYGISLGRAAYVSFITLLLNFIAFVILFILLVIAILFYQSMAH